MKEIFISYSHENHLDQQELIKHLSVLKRIGLINDWSDKDILVGEESENKIKEKLDDADLLVLLVSAEYLASDYLNKIELTQTFKHPNEDGVRIFPVILNYCMWKETELNAFKAVPIKGGQLKPISDWEDKNKAFFSVSLELLRSIDIEPSNDENIAKVYNYKEQTDKLRIPSNNNANQFSLGLDNILKGLLIFFLLLFVSGCFYGTIIMEGDRFERLLLVSVSLVLFAISITAYFIWRYMELKYFQAELRNA